MDVLISTVRMPCFLTLVFLHFLLALCHGSDTFESQASVLQQTEGDRLHQQTGLVANLGVSLFEGDLLVTFTQIAEMYGLEFAAQLQSDGFVFVEETTDDDAAPHDDDRKLGVTIGGLWPDRKDGKVQIPYKIEDIPHYDAESRAVIQSAMEELEMTGVFKFIQRTTEAAYFNITLVDPDVCYSRGIGYSGFPHELNFGWCNKAKYSIVHGKVAAPYLSRAQCTSY